MINIIAEIGSNYDCSLDRAKELIRLAKESGANIVKFQKWTTSNFINDKAFQKIGNISHQEKWNKPVYEIYAKYELPTDWIPILSAEAHKYQMGFMMSIYDIDLIDELDKYIDIYKIGSGDITYYPMLEKIASKKKLIVLGTGASNILEIIKAVNVIQKTNPMIVLMQCLTDYTTNQQKIYQSCINVLKSYKCYFPDIEIGISDHSKSILPITTAISLGARYIEKHFTDGKSESPDNDFALNPIEFKYMVNESIETLKVLGNTFKEVQPAEMQTSIIQRRCFYAAENMVEGHILTNSDVIPMRPALPNCLLPIDLNMIEGKIKLKKAIDKLNPILISDIEFVKG